MSSSTEVTPSSMGESPLKRQKMTQIEKGQSSQSSKPPTTPSQLVHVQKQQPPPRPTEPKWIDGYTLSQHPLEIRQALFMKKHPSVSVEKKVNMEDFEDFNVMDPIYKMGWGGILELESDICYDQAVIEWMSTLQRHGDGAALTLTGTVRGREYTLTYDKIRRMFSVDTGIRGEPGRAYEYPDESDLEPLNLETHDWIKRLQELFVLPSFPVEYPSILQKAIMKPQAMILWRVGVWNIFPGVGYQKEVLVREISILYALITGKVAISYAHVVMLNLWATYNKNEYKSTIPHGYLLSGFLYSEGAIARDMKPRKIKLLSQALTKNSMPHLKFWSGPPPHIIDKNKRTFVPLPKFKGEERKIVKKEKAERVRRRDEKRHWVQQQAQSRNPPSAQETINPDHLGENALPTKVSSPECSIICVRGYNVKKSCALILEAIFARHGDIAAECIFETASLRASFLEVVCEVVMQLQTNDDSAILSKIKEMERKVSEAEAAKVHVSWLRSHLEARKKPSLLMEMKANTSIVKRAAKMDLRERSKALMVAEDRFKKAKRCVEVLSLVEKKLEKNILESKNEQDLLYL